MSHFVAPVVSPPGPGQVALEVFTYRAAKPWSRLSLSGSPPTLSFQAHWLMSCGSFDPPPVKSVQFEPVQAPSGAIAPWVSSAQATAVAPWVLSAVAQTVPPVAWWQTRSQSSGAAPPEPVALVALPSSSNSLAGVVASAIAPK